MVRKSKSEKQKPEKLPSKFAPWIVRAGVLATTWAAIAFVVLILFYAIDLPNIDKPKELGRRPSLTILARDGSVLVHTGQSQGDFYTLKQLPKYVPEAVMAIEDRRFYHHFGIDPIGIIRASFENLLHHDVVQGGSTLTQQLAKNMFLSPEQNLKRKVQEAMLAIGLEMKYSKDQILAAYLNRVYMGAGAYGIDAAAHRYFNKPASELSLREAATIAGLLRAPNYFSPVASPSRAADRANVVLKAMVEAGYITPQQERLAESTPPPPGHKPGSGDGVYYAADYVAAEALKLMGDAKQDLTIATTIDAGAQRAAEQAVDEIMPEAETKNVTETALVAVGPDGGVRAIIGGANYHDSPFNRAFQAQRQPGSSFKPVIYLAGLEAGITPSTEITDAPISFGSWSPENFDKQYFGKVTVAFALAKSLNSVAVQILNYAGVERAVDVARRLGITSNLDANLSLALGTSVVSPIELATMYNTIAQLGAYHQTYVIDHITNADGDKLYQYVPFEGKQVAARENVAALTMMMTGVVNFGTGTAANIGRPQAGKTGTSQDYRDAWFAGFVPQLTAIVWMGNDDNAKMQRVTGGSFPARLWADFMKRTLGNAPALPLDAASVNYDSTPKSVAFMSEVVHWNAPAPPVGAANPPLPTTVIDGGAPPTNAGIGFDEIIQDSAKDSPKN